MTTRSTAVPLPKREDCPAGFDARLVRSLTMHRLYRPDPAAWLAAADHLEECGLDEPAAVWRARGLYFDAVVGLYEEVKSPPDGLSYRHERQVGSVILLAFAIRNNVAMCVILPGSRLQVASYRWATNFVRTHRRYISRRALELIDANARHFRGEGARRDGAGVPT
jgi:hypothetical protein